MLAYSFMRRALIAGLLLSIAVPLVGTVVVNRKTSTIGDALSHTSLAGISLGLILSFNPIIGAITFSILAAFAIEKVRSKFPANGDLATAIITSLGIGLAAILSDFVPGAQNFESFLFGSIVSISRMDLIIITIMTLVVVYIYIKLYYDLMHISVDKTSARLAGINISKIENLFTIILAITVAIASRVVGVLMISSLMVLPVASALLISKNYKQTIIYSVVFGLIQMILGIVISYYFNLKPGGTMVLLASIILMFLLMINKKR